MRFGRKGQLDIKVILLIVIILTLLGAFSYISMNQFFQGPLSYADAWERWAEEAFKSDDKQPWRALSLFVLPFVFYFAVNYLALSITYLGASMTFGRREVELIYKPVMVICFAVAMMMLPSPTTFGMAGWFMGLSGFGPIMVIVFFAIGLPLTFVFIYAMGQQVRSRLPHIRREEEEREEAPRPPTRPHPRAREMPEPPEAPDLPDLPREILNLFRDANRQIIRAIERIDRIR